MGMYFGGGWTFTPQEPQQAVFTSAPNYTPIFPRKEVNHMGQEHRPRPIPIPPEPDPEQKGGD